MKIKIGDKLTALVNDPWRAKVKKGRTVKIKKILDDSSECCHGWYFPLNTKYFYGKVKLEERVSRAGKSKSKLFDAA